VVDHHVKYSKCVIKVKVTEEEIIYGCSWNFMFINES
jgi:hypothetical protein